MSFYDFVSRDVVRLDPALEKLAYDAIGAAIEVHKELGPGLPEVAYREALCHEFDIRGIHYQREVPVPIVYMGKQVGAGRIDLVVERRLVLELKVVEVLNEVHRAQAISYLKAAKLQLALLINFNVAILKDGIKRVINKL